MESSSEWAIWSKSQIASCIAQYAPCFWCCRPEHLHSTDRENLLRLNLLCTVFALAQTGTGIFLIFVLFFMGGTSDAAVGEVTNEQESDNQIKRDFLAPNMWNLVGSTVLLGIIGFFVSAFGLYYRRSVRNVDILGSLRYYWFMVWIIPIELFFAITLFDYHRVTEVWVVHWWTTEEFTWFREQFCSEGTANGKCNGPELYIDQWCINQYNSTDCGAIQDNAQMYMMASSYIFFTINAVWALILTILLYLSHRLLENILTTPIIRESTSKNLPIWLILPIAGCIYTGATLMLSPTAIFFNVGIELKWIAVTYLVSAGTFFITAALGWGIANVPIMSAAHKRRQLFAVHLFICTVVLTIISVSAIFCASLIYSSTFLDLDLSSEEVSLIACKIDTADSCSGCNKDNDGTLSIPVCPEWSEDDVVKVICTQLKQSAILAAIFFIYALSALQFGFILRRHIKAYQIDYV
uniref:Uncharacterized protein n=2 Tax=Leptocylindrus danicus TaxID=163516 RepID=A0A7S2JSH7_9STRA|mmetsp:Transcript_11055/g.16730  ORF Transcript_11055/g.16730 Transcript_11055/m.16730 type:complete len:466 (+) Transcript_11055:193-1590(+)